VRALLAAADRAGDAALARRRDRRSAAGDGDAAARGQLWREVLGPNDPTPDPNRRPFDVTEWRDAAHSIGVAAAELRGFATEIETLSGSTALDRAIDRAFWRGAALIVFFFVALLGYRLLATRLTRPPA
jgi:hypothetical protein